MTMFKKATKLSSRLRLAFIGPAGSGKTYSALSVATHLGGKVAVIDTERGSASKYADLFSFDVLEPTSFAPEVYTAAIHEAEKAGYDVIVIDSLSHAWMGKDGALEQVDGFARRDPNHDSFGAWRNVTPHHNAMVDAILASGCHVIATMRAKTEYVKQKDQKGKTVIRKVGLAPVQRDGLEYEFDVVGDINFEHAFHVTKTRCSALADALIDKPGKQLAETLITWLAGAPAPDISKDDVESWQTRIKLAASISVEKLGELRDELNALPKCAAKEGLRRFFEQYKTEAVRLTAERLKAGRSTKGLPASSADTGPAEASASGVVGGEAA